jgi:hypothetical protein
MAEAYKKAKLITTAGATNGFVGFQNLHTSNQNVTISGPFIYGITGACGAQPITINVNAGQVIPVNCVSITPGSANVLGFLA